MVPEDMTVYQHYYKEALSKIRGFIQKLQITMGKWFCSLSVQCACSYNAFCEALGWHTYTNTETFFIFTRFWFFYFYGMKNYASGFIFWICWCIQVWWMYSRTRYDLWESHIHMFIRFSRNMERVYIR